MIITKLKGGLGNQMFQYAIGRNLAHINKDELSLDISWYKTSRQWPYPFHLDRFNIIDSKHPKSGYPLIEKTYQYNAEIFDNIKKWDNYTLEGYWQSEKYFKDITSIIRNDLQLKKKYMSAKYSNYLELINSINNSVFVHIRRGERVTDKRPRLVHGLIESSFYDEAIKFMQDIIPNCTMIFFTDNYSYTLSKYCDNGLVIESLEDYEHLSLMSKCKHAIIANSSFSWWAAWLINNPKKIVVAPSKWTVDIRNSNSDIVPNDWKKIDLQF